MSLEKASISWSAKQLKNMIASGKIDFNHIIQRSYVWERKRKSALIESMEDMTEDYFTYENSDLRKALNGEILARFPEEIRSRMVALNGHGDLLRIPTEREIFGENVYGQPDGEKRWKCMKKRRNRIAFQGKEGAWEWYWLMNRHKDSASYFARVGDSGNANYNNASNSNGVRPDFDSAIE